MDQIHGVTIVIIIANVIVSLKGFDDFYFFEKYKFNVGGVIRGERFRMLSSGFLHANWIHFGFNMGTMLTFSYLLEMTMGATSFLLIYFLSMIGGTVTIRDNGDRYKISFDLSDEDDVSVTGYYSGSIDVYYYDDLAKSTKSAKMYPGLIK